MSGQRVVGDPEPGHQVLTEQGADNLREVWRNPLIDRDQAFIKFLFRKPHFIDSGDDFIEVLSFSQH